jgi:predicted RNA-binding protein YlxR (DUF448 family)
MPRVHHVPVRQCVACRQMRPKRELVRVVRTPAGEIRVDTTGKVSGRGAYVCPTTDCVDQAVKQGRLAHALEVAIPVSIADALRSALTRSVRVSGES